ncbi:bifunctional riboflavin kinase/FAD synthetase [Aliidiomarina sedimenti]|uniref:Riboflavin biosynthesis protein n=1 Tax=Aliidiomarina sedimenti TaxID=1933879 RepID=A0ABY0BZX7_9GAMM|nr:bifunctional riboflavin kinase/FAD synthetase [Aliidiomarina sedimenti]RUO30118.1 bifunctional riboflavin kinase/FAD synthetase [Aliidiomarina sedimenti]
MELIRGLHTITPSHRHCVLTIGNFDGVHLGHQAVLQRVRARAAELQLPAVVMTFEPQPLEFFRPEIAPARLTTWREKYQLLKSQGIQRMLCTPFNQKFASQAAETFVKTTLVDKLGVKLVVVGDDFRFGKDRAGDFALLQAMGEQYNFAVVDTQSYRHDTQRVSSTLIREALEQGHFADAEEMLGRPFTLCGKVSHGAKKGRTIGFPTANVPLKRLRSPLQGVFVVQVEVAGKRYNGVANIGRRPTVNGQGVQLEAHLFNFAGDLYGEEMVVTPLHKIRDEVKFASLEELKQQIHLDVMQAQAYANR